VAIEIPGGKRNLKMNIYAQQAIFAYFAGGKRVPDVILIAGIIPN
jgi:hypothetical protein